MIPTLLDDTHSFLKHYPLLPDFLNFMLWLKYFLGSIILLFQLSKLILNLNQRITLGDFQNLIGIFKLVLPRLIVSPLSDIVKTIIKPNQHLLISNVIYLN